MSVNEAYPKRVMSSSQYPTGALIGGMLLGRYRVVRELAKGGMGVVYLARVEGAVGFVKPVVVKLILPEHARDERFLRMFAREAQIVSQLRHPSVVDVLEFGEHDGAYVMVIEYVRGHHLGQWFRYLELCKRRIPPQVAIQVISDILDALHHAHSLTHPDGRPMHIVHRDISPSNILLDQDGRARLLDFGVARMRGGSIDYQTQANGFVGKLTYTAPEIFTGEEATAQSDLYSCAVVLHEAILGRNVFKGETQAETMTRVLSRQPQRLSTEAVDVPPGLDDVLHKALAKAPADRFATASDFSQALRALLPVSESDVRATLAAILKQDFSLTMAEMLGIESLDERDEAWRKLSMPARRPATLDGEESSHAQPRDEVEETRDRRPARPSTMRMQRVQPNLTPSGRGGRAADSMLATEVAASDGWQSDVTSRRARRNSARSIEAVAASAVQSPKLLPTVAPLEPKVVQVAEVPVPSRGSPVPRRVLLLGVLGLLSLSTAVVVLTLQRSPAPVMVPHIRVVATPNVTSNGAAPGAPTPGDGRPTQDSAGASAGDQVDTTEPAPKPGSPKDDYQEPRSGPNPRLLTRAFRAQQPKVQACFAAHPKDMLGRPEIVVQFDLEASGRIKRAQVQPAPFASSELGACIARVARTTKFARQGQPISFEIPVRASRQAVKR